MKTYVILFLMLCLACFAQAQFGSGVYNFGTDVDDVSARGRKFESYNIIASIALDNTAGWATTDCALTYETTNFLSSEDDRSLKITDSGGSTITQIQKDMGGLDYSDNSKRPHVFLRAYINASGIGTIKSLSILISSEANWDNYVQAILTADGDPDGTGWWNFYGSPVDMSLVGAVEPDWTSINYLRVRVSTVLAGDTPVTILDQVIFVKRPNKAQVCWTFDDSLENDYKFAAYLTKNGMVGTFYIIASRIGQAGRLTLTKLRAMQESGHLIANHGKHSLYYTVSGLAAVVKDAKDGATWLRENGFTEGAGIYAQPGGSANFTEELKHRILGKYARQFRRTTMHGSTTGSLVGDASLLGTSSFDNQATISSRFDIAIADSGTAVFGVHSTVLSFADFKTAVDGMVAERDAGLVDIITMAELYDRGVWNNQPHTMRPNRLLSATIVDLDNNGDTTIYIVPAGIECSLTYARLVVGGDAGTGDISIGQNTAETDFIPAADLGLLNAANDVGILQPIPHTNMPVNKLYSENTVIEAQVTNENNGAAINWLYLYGTLSPKD